jgi:uncharacterized protein YwqG
MNTMNFKPETLPNSLQPFLEKISATILPTVSMQLTPDDRLTVWQSKVGGKPYLPLDVAYPLDSHGNPLALLAQFNFTEIPALPNFPDKGILQFYIAADDSFGMNYDNKQKQSDFRILYFEHVIDDIQQLKQDFSDIEIEEDDLDYLPFDGQYAVEFKLEQQPISIDDHGFNIGTGENDFYVAYSETLSAMGHRLGGYPYFTQSDPRDYNKNIMDYILLFQVDTDDSKGVNIMWGDCGVANFFIHPEDLKKRDFSKVLYNWDCC